MNREEFISKLSEETKRKLAACKTPEEERRVLMDADELVPMDDEMMAAIAGGVYTTPGTKQQHQQLF